LVLRRETSPTTAVANPVALAADAPAERLADAVRTVLADPGIDAVLVVYTPPFGSGRESTCKAIAEVANGADKPVLACVLGHDGVLPGGTPSYAFPEQAVYALSRVVACVRRGGRPAEIAAEARPGSRDRTAAAIVRQELAEHPEGRWLDHRTAARLLARYGVHVAESIEVDGPETAAEAAALTGLPAALKATGPDLVHKSDVGGVALDLATPADVAQAYREMAERLGPAMTGALVQPMVTDGVEIIIGGVEHPAFGPLIMVGMGGLTAELLTDRAFRVPPITRRDAAEMLRELRCF